MVLAAYMATTIAVLGAGLRTRLAWAWSGTLTICFIFAFVGLALPFIAAGAKSASAASTAVVAFFSVIIVMPSLLFFIHLLRKRIRESFEVGEMSTLWVRVLAVQYFIGVGFYLCEAFSPHKRALFGIVRDPIVIVTQTILMAALCFFIARGLYKFNETARKWAIGTSIYSFIQYACFVFLDHEGKSKPGFRLFTLGITTALYALTIWYLYSRRVDFTNT
jgi:heme/copper-type cytochrome/quinol oxidase subunit 4